MITGQIQWTTHTYTQMEKAADHSLASSTLSILSHQWYWAGLIQSISWLKIRGSSWQKEATPPHLQLLFCQSDFNWQSFIDMCVICTERSKHQDIIVTGNDRRRWAKKEERTNIWWGDWVPVDLTGFKQPVLSCRLFNLEAMLFHVVCRLVCVWQKTLFFSQIQF